MMKIESCEYNMDTACIDVVYTSGRTLSLYIPLIEESLLTTVRSRSQLDLLLDTAPLEYAEMVLDGTLQAYADRVDRDMENQMRWAVERLSERFSPNIAEGIAREMLMYK